jgi:two-component system chemotaxis response regulator CheY
VGAGEDGLNEVMRTLIVEDDPTSRLLLQQILGEYGLTSVAGNGCDALAAFREAFDRGEPYDLVILDIMMPEMDGQAALCEIRRLETECGYPAGRGVKVIMSSMLSDSCNVITAFREQCDAYLPKPIDKARIRDCLRELGLLA